VLLVSDRAKLDGLPPLGREARMVALVMRDRYKRQQATERHIDGGNMEAV